MVAAAMGEAEEAPLPARRQVTAAPAARPLVAPVRPPWAPQPVHAVPRRAAERAPALEAWRPS
jgi:hypothetical protein